MKIMVKCPNCKQVLSFEGVVENAECSKCHTKLIINYDDLAVQRSKIKKLTVLLNIPTLIVGFIAFTAGAKLGYIAAGILLYQVVWVTIYKNKTMSKLKDEK